MRARTFHSAFGVVAVLAGIALFAGHDHSSNLPRPVVSATARASGPADGPVVYTAPTPGGSSAPVGLYVRKVTRVVLVSTLPMGPLVNMALPYESDPLPLEVGPSRSVPVTQQEAYPSPVDDSNPDLTVSYSKDR